MKHATMQLDMALALVLLLGLPLISHSFEDQKDDPSTYLSRFAADLWLEGADVVRIIWRDCSKKLMDVKDVIDHKEYFPKFARCMKRKTLRALDRSLSPDVVPVADGVNLVRFELVDRSGDVLTENQTSTWTEQELEEGDWRTLALQRMAKVLRTHVIKFDFDDMKSTDKVEYRGRRRHQMMTMMMFGVVSIGMVMVPMGFQFLAVLGGKALLLAKMALILASIQGLKKIAASPVNYGFYHNYPPYDPHIERRSHRDWPPPSVMAATSPPAMPAQDPDPDLIKDLQSNVKVDRIHLAKPGGGIEAELVTWRPERPIAVKRDSEPRIYPVFTGVPETSIPVYTEIDAPTPVADLTTKPGEVQADFAIDLPYNGFHFQSPTAIVSA